VPKKLNIVEFLLCGTW